MMTETERNTLALKILAGLVGLVLVLVAATGALSGGKSDTDEYREILNELGLGWHHAYTPDEYIEAGALLICADIEAYAMTLPELGTAAIQSWEMLGRNGTALDQRDAMEVAAYVFCNDTHAAMIERSGDLPPR